MTQPNSEAMTAERAVEVLSLLKEALPTVGINGWSTGVAALELAIATLRSQSSAGGEAVAWICDAEIGFDQWAPFVTLTKPDDAANVRNVRALYAHPQSALAPVVDDLAQKLGDALFLAGGNIDRMNARPTTHHALREWLRNYFAALPRDGEKENDRG